MTTTVTTDLRPRVAPTLAAVIGGALVCLGSVLPWWRVSATSLPEPFAAAGTHATWGKVTLAFGVLIVLAAWGARTPHRPIALLATLVAFLSAAALGVARIIDIRDLGERVQAVSTQIRGIDVGAGLYVVVVGALLAGVAFVAEGRRRRVG